MKKQNQHALFLFSFPSVMLSQQLSVPTGGIKQFRAEIVCDLASSAEAG